jgi:hypothetical protein
MKKSIAILVIFAAIACGTKESDPKTSEDANEISENDASQTNEEVVFHPITDPKSNEAAAMMPLPANWRINNDGKGKAMIDGPDGIHVYSLPYKSFIYTEDAYMRQLYIQSGQPFRRPVNIETIISEDLLPIAQREGSTFIRQYRVAEVAKTDREYDAMLFKVFQPQQTFDAAVTEWEDAKGNPYLILIHQSTHYANNLMNWGYHCEAMEAPKASYESAKKHLVYGYGNIRYNPKSVEAYNISEAQKANASMAAFNQRMQVKQQQFESSQRAFESKRDAINAAITANYNHNSAASDRNHNRFVNYIKDEETVSANGQRYQVQSGSNQYWVNENGEYQGSNDPNYDPNRNQGTVNHTWTEAPADN